MPVGGRVCLALLIIAALPPCLLAKKGELSKSEGVYVLTGKTYDTAVSEFDYLLVYFYAPWCGHCKALTPEFVKAGQILRERESPIKLGKVDGTEETGLMEREAVTGYPTLKLYRKGQPVLYTGGRMAPEIVDWLEARTGSPATVLETVDEVKAFLKGQEVAVVGFFPPGETEEAARDGYLAACTDYADYGVHYPVGITASLEAAKEWEARGQIVLFKQFDEKKVVYKGEFEVQKIRDFITETALPSVIEFNHENAQRMFKPPNNAKAHLLVFHNKSDTNYQAEINLLRKVGAEFRDSVLLVSVDVEEEDNRRMVEFLGVRHRINNDTYPSMRIITMKDRDSGPIRYKPEDTSVSEKNVKRFLEDFLAGRVPRDYFTEPLPKDWDKGAVKYLTGVNLAEFVSDPTTQALVMFSAPWCGHCRSLAPVWEELGKKLAGSEYVVGKIDATVNEVENFPPVNSFPTIKLYRKDRTEAEYNGERTVEGIMRFVKTDGVYGMAAPDPSVHDEL